jgi:hypothetical protein
MATRRRKAPKKRAGRIVDVACEDRRRKGAPIAGEPRAAVLSPGVGEAGENAAEEASEAGRAAAYDSQVARLLGVLGTPDPARVIEANRERIDRMRRAGIDASTTAAILDARRGGYVGVLREDGGTESGSSCGCKGTCAACKTGVGAHTHESGAKETGDAELKEIIESHMDFEAASGLAFVPDVVEDVMDQRGWTIAQSHVAIRRLYANGVIELRPEGGLGRLSPAEKKRCLTERLGGRDVLLSWIRVINPSRMDGGTEERPGVRREEIDIEIDIVDKTGGDGSVCRPFTRVVRDRTLYRMCLARAKAIGEIADHRKIYELVKHDIETRTVESFFVVKLDFRGQLVDYLELAQGQQHKVAVDVEDILHGVLNAVLSDDRCDGFAIIHNHPSGNASPSPADRKLTKRVRDAARVALPTTAMIDHIVVGMDQYFSFTDDKLFKVR